ncbi:hypothetical protein [Pelagimonas phthalicica]|uniref:hypothetical protein n=1 Tax=Pelagimonas phthalicica TaxID=1037362 RepID=UPI00105D3E9E|nr:hypothetical protein [Pelagimonas phthalicica]
MRQPFIAPATILAAQTITDQRSDGAAGDARVFIGKMFGELVCRFSGEMARAVTARIEVHM